MNQRVRKEILLASLTTLLFALFVLVPPVMGYGDSFNTASVISNGNTMEYLSSTDNNAYYKVACTSGDQLSILLMYHSPHDLDLTLYNPLRDFETSSLAIDADDDITHHCDMTGTYYIKVNRASGTGSALIDLIISGANAPGIPGFEGVSILVGLLSAVFLALYLRKSRLQTRP